MKAKQSKASLHVHYRAQHCTWTTNQGDRPLHDAGDYLLPNPRTKLFKKSPLYTLPLEWNNMDDNKYIQNKTTFKTAVKFKLLNEIIDRVGAEAGN